MKITELQTVPPKDSLGLLNTNSDRVAAMLKAAKPLPNSNYYYAVIPSTGYQSNIYDKNVCLLSPDKQLIGKLDIQIHDKEAYVQGLEIAKEYRGQGLATSLYGIVLSILKLTLISDSSQTPMGARTWVSLSKIPGVEVRGLVYHPTEEQKKVLGATQLSNAAYTFPVTVMDNTIVPANSSETKLYTPDRNGFKLIAFYNKRGNKNDSNRME